MFDSNAIGAKEGKKPLLSLSGSTLKLIGYFFITAGLVGTVVLQHGLLHLEQFSAQDLMAQMQPGSTTMALATWAIVCSALATLALPLFTLAVVEGYRNTSSKTGYIMRLVVFGLISEVPFDLAMTGKAFDISAQNPLFAYAICVLLLYFLDKYDGTGWKWGVARAAMVLAAMLWAVIMQCQLGLFIVALAAVYYFFRGGGALFMAASTVVTLLQFPAPLALFLVHWYNGEKGRISKWVFYVLYPVLLLGFGIARIVWH